MNNKMGMLPNHTYMFYCKRLHKQAQAMEQRYNYHNITLKDIKKNLEINSMQYIQEYINSLVNVRSRY